MESHTNKNNLENLIDDFDLSKLKLIYGKCLFTKQSESIKPLQNVLNVPFKHRPDCSLEHIYYNKTENEIKEIENKFDDMIFNKNKKVKFASVGIIIDSNNNVLLTRRNENLRTFPKSWVFPGGVVDEGESFLAALLREIYEETGIKINRDDSEFEYNGKSVEVTPILLYESSYPTVIDQIATSQILVVYFKVKINDVKDNVSLSIQVDEVDAYVWLKLDLLKKILYPAEGNNIEFKFEGVLYEKTKKSFSVLNLNQDNFHKVGTDETIPYGHSLACQYL